MMNLESMSEKSQQITAASEAEIGPRVWFGMPIERDIKAVRLHYDRAVVRP